MTLDPIKLAEMLGELNHQSHRLHRAFLQKRGTKAASAAKRRAVDGIFLAVLGRKATEAEHELATTAAISYG